MAVKKKAATPLGHQFQTAWKHSAVQSECGGFSDAYRMFLDEGKTERESARRIVKDAAAAGYTELESFLARKKPLKAGEGVYALNRGKSVVLIRAGRKPMQQGLRIIGAHIDSPRIDLKPFPLYEDNGLCYFKTHYYGGIKKYQWTSLPLAIHGAVCLKNGETLELSIGEAPEDPIFLITDLLPHLAKDQYEKKLSEGLPGEGLNLLIGSRPEETESSDPVRSRILGILKEQYGFEEADFVSAEIEIVPAGKARDAGLDRSMVAGYGQDDRVCAYAALRGMLDSPVGEYASVTLFMDKEEVGSLGNTGSESDFLEYVLAELMTLESNDGTDLQLKRAFHRSRMLSADVTAAFDPNFSDVYDKRNSAMAGNGVVLMKYTGARGKSGCSDANAEYMAWLRRVFDDTGVTWQVAELGKVDQGGGGTIAYILANRGAEVVDCGVAVLSMHGTWELVSKADLYMTYLAYKAFFGAAEGLGGL